MNIEGSGVKAWIEGKTSLLEWVDSRWLEVRESRSSDKYWEYSLIEDYVQIIEELVYKSFINLDCGMDCPAYCCFFPHSSVAAAMIEADRIPAIKQLLYERGLGEQDYLTKMPLASLPPEFREALEGETQSRKYVSAEDGGESVYFTRLNT